jgi:hypothetical protein
MGLALGAALFALGLGGTGDILSAIEEIEHVRLQVYDLSGALVFDSGFRRGPTIQWNLETLHGRPAANGVYLYIIITQDRDGKLIRSAAHLISVLR